MYSNKFIGKSRKVTKFDRAPLEPHPPFLDHQLSRELIRMSVQERESDGIAGSFLSPTDQGFYDDIGYAFKIVNGKQAESAALESFREDAKLIKAAASLLLESLQKIALMYAIPVLIINCDKALQLCLLKLDLTKSTIMTCVQNLTSVLQLINSVGRKYQNGYQGKVSAVCTIQFNFRRYKERVAIRKHSMMLKAHHFMRLYMRSFRLRRAFLKSFNQKCITRREQTCEPLVVKNRVFILICPPKDVHNNIRRCYFLLMNRSSEVVLILDEMPANFKQIVASIFFSESARDVSPIDNGRLKVVICAVNPALRPSIGSNLVFSHNAMVAVHKLRKNMTTLVVCNGYTKYISCICNLLQCNYFGPYTHPATWYTLTTQESAHSIDIAGIMENKKFLILMTTERNNMGIIAPQISIIDLDTELEEFVQVAASNFHSGFLTFHYVVVDGKAILKSVFSYLSSEILLAINVCGKIKFSFNPTELKIIPEKLPFTIPHLKSCSVVEPHRLTIPKSNDILDRHLFFHDKVQHEMLQYMPPSICVLHLKRNGFTFDTWDLEGYLFPETSDAMLPFVCISSQRAKLYEMAQAVLDEVDEFYLEHN